MPRRDAGSTLLSLAAKRAAKTEAGWRAGGISWPGHAQVGAAVGWAQQLHAQARRRRRDAPHAARPSAMTSAGVAPWGRRTGCRGAPPGARGVWVCDGEGWCVCAGLDAGRRWRGALRERAGCWSGCRRSSARARCSVGCFRVRWGWGAGLARSGPSGERLPARRVGVGSVWGGSASVRQRWRRRSSSGAVPCSQLEARAWRVKWRGSEEPGRARCASHRGTGAAGSAVGTRPGVAAASSEERKRWWFGEGRRRGGS